MKSKLLYERALITCVLMLIVSIILKLFGVPWFNLDTSIPILNKINDIVMNSVPLSFIYSFISLFINGYIMCAIVTKTLNFKCYFIPLSFVCLLTIFVKVYFHINAVSFICDVFDLYFVSLVVSKDKNIIKEHILMIVLASIYQLCSLFIRNLGVQISYYGMVTSILLMLDYYMMLIMTYLYLKKGDYTLCSIFHRSYSSLATKLWRKPTRNSNQCSSKES